MVQQLARPGESGSWHVAFVVGSGSHAFGYLVEIANHLFQSPLSYYPRKHAWDVAPGYENAEAPDFSRPVTPECLLCHAGAAKPKKDTLNTFESPPFAAEAISCSRCHGDTAAHLRKPGPGTILNPAKMIGAARDSICEQCHLAGEIRIPNPGKTMGDFHPGEPLEKAYTVFVDVRRPGDGIKVVSHSEQLALSVCARQSQGKLWCGTCHDPHDPPAIPASYYRDKCLSCHSHTLNPTHAANPECVRCHMPETDARDGGHTAFTDHRIRRNVSNSTGEGAALTSLAGLIPWRDPEPAVRDRNLAIALATHGLENGSAAEVIRGYKLMSHLESQFPDDAALLTSLGSVLLKAKESDEALRRFRKAVALRPGFAPYEVNYAAALVAAGRRDEAIGHLQHALKLDPLLLSAVSLLGQVYRTQGEPEHAAEVQLRYREAMDLKSSTVSGKAIR